MTIYKPQKRAANLVNCPLCGAGIPRGRRKCEHCGNVLQPAGPAKPEATETSEFLGNAMIALPVIGSIVALLWIGRMSVLQDPFSKLLFVAAAVVGLTAILGLVEAVTSSGAAPEDASGPAKYGTLHWLVLLTVGWIAGLPLYLRARASRGMKDQSTAGAAVMAVFLAAMLGVGWHVKSKEAAAIAQVRELERLEQQYAKAASPPAVAAPQPVTVETPATPDVAPAVAVSEGTGPAETAAPAPAPIADVSAAPAADSFAALAAEIGVEKTAEAATIPAAPSEQTPD